MLFRFYTISLILVTFASLLKSANKTTTTLRPTTSDQRGESTTTLASQRPHNRRHHYTTKIIGNVSRSNRQGLSSRASTKSTRVPKAPRHSTTTKAPESSQSPPEHRTSTEAPGLNRASKPAQKRAGRNAKRSRQNWNKQAEPQQTGVSPNADGGKSFSDSTSGPGSQSQGREALDRAAAYTKKKTQRAAKQPQAKNYDRGEVAKPKQANETPIGQVAKPKQANKPPTGQVATQQQVQKNSRGKVAKQQQRKKTQRGKAVKQQQVKRTQKGKAAKQQLAKRAQGGKTAKVAKQQQVKRTQRGKSAKHQLAKQAQRGKVANKKQVKKSQRGKAAKQQEAFRNLGQKKQANMARNDNSQQRNATGIDGQTKGSSTQNRQSSVGFRGGRESPTVTIGDKQYLLTWRSNPGEKFTHDEAGKFCQDQHMTIVSLNDKDVAKALNQLLKTDDEKYFWAGGKVNGNTLIWANGESEPIVRGQGLWSTAGNSGPQPETEHECLAILNNIYQDGIKWHDVGCDHAKPTVCVAGEA